MQIYDIEVKFTSNGERIRYAKDCPVGMTISGFCAKLAHLIIFSADSVRMITVPGTSLTIDRNDVDGIVVATSD